MNQHRLFVCKSHWKWLEWAHTLSGVGSQGIFRERQPVLIKLIQLLPASAHWDRGGLNKERMNSTTTSLWEKTPSPALSLKPDYSVSPYSSHAPFKLLPQCCCSE